MAAGFITNKLCDIGPVTSLLQASAFSSVNGSTLVIPISLGDTAVNTYLVYWCFLLGDRGFNVPLWAGLHTAWQAQLS